MRDRRPGRLYFRTAGFTSLVPFKKFLGNQLRQYPDLRRSLLCQYDTYTATVHDWAKEQPFHAAAIKGLTQSELRYYLSPLSGRSR